MLIDKVKALAAAIGADIKSLTSGLTNKVDKVSGKGLSSNDYTATEKNTLAALADAFTPGANDVQAMKRVRIPQSSAAASGINIAPGVPVTAPQDGDVWMTTDGLFYRTGGVTRQVPLSGVPPVFGFDEQPGSNGFGGGALRGSVY